MKTTGIILSLLGTGLLITGIVFLVKRKKMEKTSGIDGESDCGCSNVTGKRKYVKGVLQHPSV
jgi:LPXTG-motif cell wall-anchored protein